VANDTRVLRVTYDQEVDAAYVYLLAPTAVQSSVARTTTVNANINLDFDDEGRLVGIEVLGARYLRPELLAEAAGTP
jgi:uncharacterized protein YuzE